MENDFGKSSILSGNLLTNAYFYVLFAGFSLAQRINAVCNKLLYVLECFFFAITSSFSLK